MWYKWTQGKQPQHGMGWFDSFRDDGLNTYYGGKRAPVIFDLRLVFIVFFTVVIATALIILVIGSRGRERWTTFLRFVLSLHTGAILLVSLTGQGWQTGYVRSHCSYTTNYKMDVHATVGLHIGLKFVNITLKGYTNVSSSSGGINYNERFTYDKVTDMEGQYIGALKKGLPWPIISVLEYVTIDKGGLRWMRALHESGHFAYILLWCAFVMWIVSNFLIGFVVSRGAVLWVGTGLLMLISHVVYHALQSIIPLEIQFKDGLMKVHYGWCFWLNLISAVITLGTGITVFMFNYIYPIQTSLTFLIDATHLKEEDTDDINKYSGPLEISTPYTQRRKSTMPTTYSNEAFSGDNQLKNNPGKRSQSFDFGHLTNGTNSYKKKPVSKTSMFDEIRESDDEDNDLESNGNNKTKVNRNVDSSKPGGKNSEFCGVHGKGSKDSCEISCETSTNCNNRTSKVSKKHPSNKDIVTNIGQGQRKSSTVITISPL